jgi:hypothetical protein
LEIGQLCFVAVAVVVVVVVVIVVVQRMKSSFFTSKTLSAAPRE